MNEGDGCVEVCIQVFAGQFKPSDNISLEFTTISPELGKFVCLSLCLSVHYKVSDPAIRLIVT